MAHFAQLNENNEVTKVILISNRRIIDDEGNESEEMGIAILNERYGEDFSYKQTSYNTRGGVHGLGGTPFRKNYCGRGHIYHPPPIDGFSGPKPFESWVLDEETCRWEAPIPWPDDGKRYQWNEESGEWAEINMDELGG